MIEAYLPSDVTNDAIFSLNGDYAGLDEVVHDAALWIYFGNKLTIVAHNLNSDDVI